MTRMSVLLFLLAALATSLPSSAQSASAKPNLTGTWIFSAQKSTLKIDPPTSMTLHIDQSDAQISFVRSQAYGEQKFDWKLETVADGQKEVVQESSAYKTNVRVYWEGASLVLDQRITASDGTQATDTVTYSLADNGRVLQAVERQTTVGGKGSTTNKWIYEKQSQ